MVANTVERSLMAKKLDRVILAIDSRETKDALKDGFEMVMTSKNIHQVQIGLQRSLRRT